MHYWGRGSESEKNVKLVGEARQEWRNADFLTIPLQQVLLFTITIEDLKVYTTDCSTQNLDCKVMEIS